LQVLRVQVIPLRFLAAGECGQIESVLGQPEQVHRLHELGLRGGVQVEMVQPGSPCIIRLAGNKLCFRSDEITTVMVRAGIYA
jgi:Fe2+ transport system protein FeoA